MPLNLSLRGVGSGRAMSAFVAMKVYLLANLTVPSTRTERLIDDLEKDLKGLMVPSNTDTRGWLLLRDRVRTWASRKDRQLLLAGN
ncbi:hypothetical protein LZK76_17440 [Rhizobium leguminosarum]|nr:hypothetical protein LZK76_17440 [Rhizobium leguminosarum]